MTTLSAEDRAAIEAVRRKRFLPMDQADELFLAGKAAGIAAERERCAKIALEQRCERDTPWDLACTTIAAVIRAANEER